MLADPVLVDPADPVLADPVLADPVFSHVPYVFSDINVDLGS